MGGPHRSSYANYVLLLRDNGDPAWSFRENGMYIAFYIVTKQFVAKL